MRKNTLWARQDGFTIVEIFITMAVIVILASVAIVGYNGLRDRTADADRATTAGQLKKLIQDAVVNNGGTTTKFLDTIKSKYVESYSTVSAYRKLFNLEGLSNKVLVCSRNQARNSAMGIDASWINHLVDDLDACKHYEDSTNKKVVLSYMGPLSDGSTEDMSYRKIEIGYYSSVKKAYVKFASFTDAKVYEQSEL